MLNTRRKRSGGGCLQWEVMRIITAALLAAACAACWLTSRTAESHPARQQHPIRKTSPSSSTPEPAPTSSTRAQLGTTPFSSYTSPVDGLGGLSFSPLAVGDGWTAFVHSLYSPREPKERDISWISQLTGDRIRTIDIMLTRWSGPVALVIYTHNVTLDLERTRHLRPRADLHFVPAMLHPGRPYPVNTLRNVAIGLARSNWYLLCDADFVPSAGSYEYISHMLADWDKSPKPTIYILPAFQITSGNDIPLSKEDLLAMGQAAQQVHPEPGRSIAHSPSDYPRWRNATLPYTVTYKMPYEPYFCADKRTPRFSNEFAGYGNDKTGHAFEIAHSGYIFEVLPRAFVIHVYHSLATWIKAKRAEEHWDVMNSNRLSSFYSDIEKRHPTPALERFNATTVRGKPGESCEDACWRNSEMTCSPSHAWKHGTGCAELIKVFGNGACRSCLDTDEWYGSDLPAYNGRLQRCLANGRPDEWPLACMVSDPTTERLCPCLPAGVGPPSARKGWLNAEYAKRWSAQ